jgi:hypothetical protein
MLRGVILILQTRKPLQALLRTPLHILIQQNQYAPNPPLSKRQVQWEKLPVMQLMLETVRKFQRINFTLCCLLV